MDKNSKQEFELGYTIKKENSTIENQMELIYQSNLIEGIRDYWIQTVKEGEDTKLKPVLTEHLDALKYVAEKYNLNLNNEEVKKTHFILMKDLIHTPGEYRKGGNSFIASHGNFILGNPLPKHVQELMDSWLEKTIKAERFEELLDLHYEYELIHPFDDGNGRSGRLILNWLTLQKLGVYTIIEKQQREEYIRKIGEYRTNFKKEHPGIVFTTYDMLSKTTKDRMKREHINYHKFLIDLFKRSDPDFNI